MKKLVVKDNRKKLPKEFRNDDNRFLESLVRYFLNKYTIKGDKIFDPFAGLGTTLIVSEKMQRIPYGIEIDERRYDYIKTNIKHKKNIILGNSLELQKNKFPNFDFSITSPPYNPIDEENYLSGKGGYKGFIKDLGKIYSQLKKFMKKDAIIVIESANLKGKRITPLPRDIKREISKIFKFEDEIIVDLKTKSPKSNCEYVISSCLIFKNS